MIFVTVGSQKFQFNRLLEKTDQMVKDGIITEEVFMQTGASDYVPRHCRYQAFYNCDEFSELMEKSDVVITHGGTGTIIKSVKMGKKTIVIPRLARYGEHVDDHQLQLLERFREMNLVFACPDLSSLPDALSCIRNHRFSLYQSGTESLIASIDDFIYSIQALPGSINYETVR
ncbi:MAG: beta(1,3)galactosyltransferase EpsH [Lachnospiraceae bacterium]|nr:beta(1,3)galactosyltransferase EpsH [Lachnospiraceae bacterium]